MPDASEARDACRGAPIPRPRPDRRMDLRCRCSECGAVLAALPPAPQCPACGGPLELVPVRLPAFPRPLLQARAWTLWRYREALPDVGAPVSLGETVTPLVPLGAGCGGVLLKCEHQLPTGSYKDRGAALLMSYLRACRVTAAVEDSSGNAAASLAAYAARAGIALTVFCPATAAAAKLAQSRCHGARVKPIPGPRAAATEALRAHLREQPVVYASHLWHPLFLEGVKTMAFEIVEQLGWVAPAAVVCPVGAGSILLGLYRGFAELRQAGAIARLPRLVAVQTEAMPAVWQAFHAGADTVAPCAEARPTRAAGIALPGPVRGRQVLEALRASGGTAIAVSETEIRRGEEALGRAGFCVEPTSAVVWPALQRLRTDLGLAGAAVVVAVLSGHGLKTMGDAAP